MASKKGISKAFSKALADGRKKDKPHDHSHLLPGECLRCAEVAAAPKAKRADIDWSKVTCAQCGMSHGMPFGRRATATAGTAPFVTCDLCRPHSCTSAPGQHGRWARARAAGAHMAKRIDDAAATSARALDTLTGGAKLAKLEVTLMAGTVQIRPIAGKESIFASEFTDGLRVEIMFNTEGELIMELTRDGQLMGTANVADHFEIR